MHTHIHTQTFTLTDAQTITGTITTADANMDTNTQTHSYIHAQAILAAWERGINDAAWARALARESETFDADEDDSEDDVAFTAQCKQNEAKGGGILRRQSVRAS